MLPTLRIGPDGGVRPIRQEGKRQLLNEEEH